MKSLIAKSLRVPLAILAFHALSATAFATPPTITVQPQITSFSLLHGFTGGNDGGNPDASLIRGTDGRLYGTTPSGGTTGNGNVFAVNPDGTGYTTLYSFTGGTDGASPYGGLIQGTDGRLYGTTPFNGANGSGTVFAVNSDGTGFTTLYSFTDGTDGAAPSSNLIQGPNGRLYGTTTGGGANTYGTVFAINPDGTNFVTLCSFTGINDGAFPSGGLILGTDGRLYGTTPGSASTSNNSFGTVFALNPDGTGFTTLYTFTNGNDGAQPFGGLIQGTDGRLYGTAAIGGTNNNGTVFAMNSDGTGFAALYSFTGGSDGSTPQSRLIQGTDGRLYGTAAIGGTTNSGDVFALKPDGTDFITLYNFTGGSDGLSPAGGLFQGTDVRLYGTTQNGGPTSFGTLFAISSQVVLTGTNATFTVAATGTAPLSYQWKFAGVDIPGATSATFTITNVIAANAGIYTVVVSNAEGSATSPAATLALTSPGLPSTPVFTPPAGTYSTVQSIFISSTGANSIYYTTDGSTPTTASTLYTGAISISTTTTLSAIGVNAGGSSPVTSGTYAIHIPPQITLQPNFSLIYSFTDGNDGANPFSNLLQGTDGRLYGTAQAGGANGAGTVYAVNTDATGFTTLYTFTGGIDGKGPSTGLIHGTDGRLYGTSFAGGLFNFGTVFAVNPDGTGFTTLYSFTGGSDGGNPVVIPIQGIDGRLYGTTRLGGTNNFGTLFAVNPDGTGFTALYSFTNVNSGVNVGCSIFQRSDGRLYGTTAGSGIGTNHGTVFVVNSDGTGFTTLYSFTNGNDGAAPNGPLIQGTDGRLYGTSLNGADGGGTVFAINPDGTGFATIHSFSLVGNDGQAPQVGLIQGTDGRLYGTTTNGGPNNDGTVFALNPDGTGFTTLYSFTGGIDGALPAASVIQGTDGRLYGVAVDNGIDSVGTVYVLSSPQVVSGTNVAYTVAATGTAPLSYQWQFNGVNINGATGATLTLTNVNSSNGGSYTVVVSNPYGSVTSTAVAFTVIPLPSAPVFAPAPGTYSTAQSVTITSAGATSIRYTTDGTAPTVASTLYTGPVSIAATTKLSAIGVNLGSPSPVTSGTYTILPPSAPVFTPAPGTYSTTQSVSITSTNATSIYYTTNGSTPTTASALYTGAISISATTKLSAIGVDAAGSSSVTSGTYTILLPPSAPVFAPVPGTYSTAQSVGITSAGATSIYYTTNGSTPTTASTLYTGPISIAANTTTLRAIGVNAAGSSPITSGTYTILTSLPSAPVFSPVPGTYSTAQSVSITSANATHIYYTTNGSTPTTASTLYTGAISISATTKLSAIGVNAAGSSPVTSGTYTILTPPPSAPVFSPVPGTYSTAQSVSITSANATHIYYTTNGSTPTTCSTLYTGAISISTTTTLRAIGVNAAGSSPVTSGTYTICIKTAPPVITHEPQSQTVNSGCNVTFTVTATSNAPLTYQWEFNGRKISCANNSTLTLHDVTTANAGAYTVVVTNSGGSATSAVAELTVQCTDQHHDSGSNSDCNSQSTDEHHDSQSNDDGDSHSDDDR
jgi:uncharacterized repeat protein (TIGR03803 family)